ncbi:protein of unknown function (DUF2017) [Streptoalloteichus tenebrarius]|uniref:DUF2017 domain-containing protein n=1 Tax=Streptoalloteichus tenebrarius (strain ATCC 17920 / DSM 40477 / JCM 4838 / CBS 697.72 / NBRC 16177 / NCIMB 11028 / NRRL B-12390 / A12253. 1 / ISP 5477) TaxID=1933 RepID=A0ABT1I3U0_STRSD|nr:DUF2017 domain-containing protein [Streptoalloteichus tenebrarius]MCP2262391.1 protein of unknown function (DUF2017) [Streptoalloteichus tenebrarius]BFF00851.1 DUF2017 domain-containing protein [Streptoalloteichus tenebrarius]
MEAWKRHGAQIVGVLDRQEAALVRGMVGQIKDMLDARVAEQPEDELAALTGIRTGHSSPPEDPILARLLPDFHRVDLDEHGELPPSAAADMDAAAAMRSLHEPELLDRKTGVAAVVLRTCPPDGGVARLSEEEAEAWLTAINDVRLALGTALQITEDTPDVLPEDDPRGPHYGVYQWLTWVQESLVQAVVGGDEFAN